MKDELLELVARTICWACDENPNHPGDCRGNDKRWQDYTLVAQAAIEAMSQWRAKWRGGWRYENP